MCGRYVLTLAPEAMRALFAAEVVGDVPLEPNYNVCPTQQVPVVVSHAGGRVITAMRWGFVPHWAKALNDAPLLINARAETLAEKPAFRAAARTRRCLIPANGFYEWTKDEDGKRLPWFAYQKDNAAMVFAAIWQAWTDPEGRRFRTVAIVTTLANVDLSPIHQRMPVILAPEDWPLWLGESGPGAAVLMRPAPEGQVTAHRVDPAVNTMTAMGPKLLSRC
ncbi:MAG: SOS response-associated peptidase [Pseudomonadota bacterium]